MLREPFAALARKAMYTMTRGGTVSSPKTVFKLKGLNLVRGTGDGAGEASSGSEAHVVENFYGFWSLIIFGCFCQEYWRARAAQAEAALRARD